jgi:hypothetical protein
MVTPRYAKRGVVTPRYVWIRVRGQARRCNDPTSGRVTTPGPGYWIFGGARNQFPGLIVIATEHPNWLACVGCGVSMGRRGISVLSLEEEFRHA